MPSQFGFFTVTEILVIAGPGLLLLYFARSSVLKILLSPFDLVIAGLTFVGVYCRATANSARSRYLQLRDIYSVTRFQRELLDKRLKQMRLIDSIGEPSIKAGFDEQGLVFEMQKALDDFARYPREMAYLQTDDDESPRVYARKFRRSLRMFKLTRGLLAESRRLLRQVADHQKKDHERLERIVAAESSFRQLVETMSVEDARDKPEIGRLSRHSILTPFLWFGLLTAAFVAALIANGVVLYLPLTEMVGDQVLFETIPPAYALAMAIIFVEAALGVAVLEALGLSDWGFLPAHSPFTRVFGVVCLVMLTVLAIGEGTLVFARDRIAASDRMTDIALGLEQGAAAAQATETLFGIGIVGQVALALILPYGIAILAMAIKPFLESSRIIAQGFVSILFGIFADLARFLRLIFRKVRQFVRALIDLSLFTVPAIVLMLLRPIKAVVVAIIEKLLPNIRWPEKDPV